MMFITFTFLLVICIGHCVHSWPNGAPTAQPGVCETMLPHHQGIAPRSLPVPYTIVMESDVIEPKGRVRFVIGSPDSRKFRGILVVARAVKSSGDTEPQGKFHLTSGLKMVKVSDCGSVPKSAVTHKSAEEKTEVHIDWEAPSEEGSYEFFVTIVEKFDIFWVELRSPFVTIRGSHVGLSNRNNLHGLRKHAGIEVFQDCDPKTTSAHHWLWCLGLPENCIKTKNCDLFSKYSGISNAHRLLFQLQGKLHRPDEYVVLGISRNNIMGSNPVFACRSSRKGVKLTIYYNASKTSRSVQKVKSEHIIPRIAGTVQDRWLSCDLTMNPIVNLSTYGEPMLNIPSNAHLVFISDGRIEIAISNS